MDNKDPIFIEIPIPLNTPVCVVQSNQHDGAWVEAELFGLQHLSGWGSTVFETYDAAKHRADTINQQMRDQHKSFSFMR